jgi:hypothetical protein
MKIQIYNYLYSNKMNNYYKYNHLYNTNSRSPIIIIKILNNSKINFINKLK